MRNNLAEEETSYVGVKVTIPAELAKARLMAQIDVGFGDAVTPGPVQSTYPTLIKDFPAPQCVLILFIR